MFLFICVGLLTLFYSWHGQLGGIAEVFLTHVNDDGRIYVTIESETYSILEHMLTTARGETVKNMYIVSVILLCLL